jgi:L-cysteate sulfo-lyase
LIKYPSIKLASLPTPLDEAPRLADKIGLSKLFIKRDDLTGLSWWRKQSKKT